MNEYMCSQIYLHKTVHAYSFPMSLINSTIMDFNLLRFLGSLTMVVALAISFTRTIDRYANLAQKEFPEEEGPTPLQV